jgi:Mg-chelatase subunit ChlI
MKVIIQVKRQVDNPDKKKEPRNYTRVSKTGVIITGWSIQMPAIFPFTAIVGQERMRRALILNAVDTRIGGVLIRGERGTAKSTAARSLAALLPHVKVVQDCRFGCDPDKSGTWCTECKERYAVAKKLPTAERATPFVNLPVSATEDRVVGTLDIEKAIQKGERHFEPGVLAGANRGLLYIDEVNLLDDHVVDILLDSAAMGVNTVEREGISFAHPARFILVGTMNPEEGDLRPQLLDRFALSVEIVGIREARERMMIMERNIAYEKDPEAFRSQWQPKEDELSKQIAKARELVDQVKYTTRDLLSIAALTASLNVDGHRADMVILKAARAEAAFEGRTKINDHDIALAAELALPHRIKRTPFQQAEMTTEQLQERIEQLAGQSMPSEEDEESESQQADGEKEEKKT